MANEIYASSNPGPADMLVGVIASRNARLLLGSRMSLRNAPWLVNLGQDLIGLSASGNLQIGLVSLGGTDLMSSVAENASISNTSVTTDQATCTPADYGLAREVSDKALRRDPTGLFDPMSLAMDGVASAGMTLTSLLAQELDGLTQVGTTGADFTHDTFLAAQFALEQALVPGPYASLLKPKQFNDWQNDLESRGGLTQWRPASADMQMLRGEGYKGNYNGIDIMTSGLVQSANSGADWAGAMWGVGCVGYLEEAQGPVNPAMVVLLEVAGPGGVVIRVELSRNSKGRMTATVTHYIVGTCVIEAARGRTLISGQ